MTTTSTAGTKAYTPWIWVLALLPIVSIGNTLVTWATTHYDPATKMLTGSSTLTLLIGLMIIGISIVCAVTDRRRLIARGIDRPFHWAWIFFIIVQSLPVYMIGRSIVVRRRTGSGLAPMWVNVVLIVASFGVGAAYTASLVASIVS